MDIQDTCPFNMHGCIIHYQAIQVCTVQIIHGTTRCMYNVMLIGMAEKKTICIVFVADFKHVHVHVEAERKTFLIL